MSIFLGVDTGGTFTDFVLYQDGKLSTHKVLSTPDAPEQAILEGIRELGLTDKSTFSVVHGSTVATNAVLEGKGVNTVFITNRGFRDLLSIARQTRRELYNLQPVKPSVPVRKEYCLETGGRLSANGEVIEPITERDILQLTEQVKKLAPQSVAINLLFSYLDDSFEKQIEAALPEKLFISRSSSVLPEFKEYERGMTTWLNAYVGPLVKGYLQRLSSGATNADIAVMQSSGGTIAADHAGDEAVHMLLSGPAGGLAAARYMGELTGRKRLLTFDMGGTSTDVALIDGELQLTSEGHIGDYPVAIPMVDMHTIGAGGGSIARVDAGDMLQVGPESAGASPGPVCYGKGGVEPTVTDANLVLGRLRPDAFLGGDMSLDVNAARKAIKPVALSMNLTIEQAANGIIRIANEHMAHALRVMSVQRGIDPRDLTLVSFGGAGGLHVCALAEAMNMKQAMVPIYAGVLSAMGMLVAPRSRQLSRSIIGLLDEIGEQCIEEQFSQLAEHGLAALLAEGIDAKTIQTEFSLDLRYQGQSYYLNIPWTKIETAKQAFHHSHQGRYGHSELNHDQVIKGPALITEIVSTTFIATGWQSKVDNMGNLLLTNQQHQG
ncbi:MAG: hydantoinase/oxoprolinase family protein [Gammaproteobacteria bacterium]